MRADHALTVMRRVRWVLVSTWLGAAAWVVVSAWIPHRVVRDADALPGPTAPESAEQQSLEHDVERFSLNALLVPLLDTDAEPMRWADPSIAIHCDSGTRVQVNGRPLQPGAAIAGRAFTVVWALERCLPFGEGGPELTGHAELNVSRDPDGLTAMVRLTDLRVHRQGHRVVMNRAFPARMR